MRPFGIVELVRTGRIAMVRVERGSCAAAGPETK
jgi:acetolactate synthase small subunit